MGKGTLQRTRVTEPTCPAVYYPDSVANLDLDSEDATGILANDRTVKLGHTRRGCQGPGGKSD